MKFSFSQNDFKLILVFIIFHLLGGETQRVQNRIVGGSRTTLSRVGGYVVNLRYDGIFFCGGTLVSSQFVVTAAHCVYKQEINRIQVQGGVSRLSDRGVVRRVQKIMYSRLFNLDDFKQDIAVLKLRQPMTGNGIRPIALCSSNWQVGSTVRASGWGITNENNENNPNQLRTVQLRILRKVRCRVLYQDTGNLEASTFCAAARGKDTCSGDSGGGIIYNNQLCGVVSWGDGCAVPGSPGVYTSIHRMRKFIDNAMRK